MRLTNRASNVIWRIDLKTYFWKYTNLTWLVAPQLLPFSFGEGSLTWGEPITVQCMTTAGDLPMTLRWMFHGQELSSQMGISTLRVNPRVSLLSIDAVAAGHAGVYTCTAENAAGSSNQSASLSVNGLLIKSNIVHISNEQSPILLFFRAPLRLYRDFEVIHGSNQYYQNWK